MSRNNEDPEDSKYQVPAEYAQKIRWLFLVLADQELSAEAKVIATRLMHYHNDQSGRCNPRHSVLAKATGMVRQQVVRYVAELVRRGWIASGRVFGGSSLYRLEVGRVEPLAIPLKPKRPQPTRGRSTNQKLSDASNIGLSDGTDNGLSVAKDMLVSDSTDNSCPSASTGVVRDEGHRTLKEPHGKQIDEPQPQLRPHRSNEAAPVTPVNANAREPEFETIDGVAVPVRLMAEWMERFRHIDVRNEVYGLVRWTNRAKIEDGRRLGIIEDKLNQKEREARDRKQEMQMKSTAEAEAAVKHRMRASRPAI